MKENNPYQILDDVLSCFRSSSIDNTIKIEHFNIIKTLYKKTVATTEIMEEAIEKLVKEKYLDRVKITPVVPENKYPFYQYNLTYEGILLIKNGGYLSKIKSEKADIDRKVFYGNVVFVGSIVGGIYAGIEIWKDILELWFKYDFSNPFR